jgi:hypothetical protein
MREPARLGAADQKFISEAAVGGQFEVEAGKIAERWWEALLAKPEPRTPLQRLRAERSNLLVVEKEVLRAVTKRESEDRNEVDATWITVGYGDTDSALGQRNLIQVRRSPTGERAR